MRLSLPWLRAVCSVPGRCLNLAFLVGRGQRWAAGYTDCLWESCPWVLLLGPSSGLSLGPGGSTTLGLYLGFSQPLGVWPHSSTLFCTEVSTPLQEVLLDRTQDDLTLALSCKLHVCTSKVAAHPCSSPEVLSPPFSCLLGVPVPSASGFGLGTSALSLGLALPSGQQGLQHNSALSQESRTTLGPH